MQIRKMNESSVRARRRQAPACNAHPAWFDEKCVGRTRQWSAEQHAPQKCAAIELHATRMADGPQAVTWFLRDWRDLRNPQNTRNRSKVHFSSALGCYV